MKIILKAKDGSIAVMSLVEGADKKEAIKKFKEMHVEDMYEEQFELKEDKLPKSREFRDAWTVNGSNIVVDSSKASLIHKKHIRHARNAALNDLDKEQLKYLSDVEKLKEIEDRKQILRDLPSKIKNLEWPDGLKRV